MADIQRVIRREHRLAQGRPDDFQGPRRFERRPDGAAVLTK